MKFLYTLILLCIGGLLGYSTWMSFGTFGTARTLICVVISIVTLSLLHTSPITQKTTDSEVVFNAKEYPKLIGVLIILAVCTYLFWFAQKQDLTQTQMIFVYTQISIIGILPTLWLAIRIFRDRNDYISISTEKLIISNAGFFSKEYTEIPLTNIKNVDRDQTSIHIHKKDGYTFSILGAQMNLFDNEMSVITTSIRDHVHPPKP